MVFHGPGDLRDEEVPMPRPAAGEVVLRVEAALTCGTDVKMLRRGHPVMIPHVPTVFGHEFAGTVSAVGAGVRACARATALVAANSAPCGECRARAWPGAPTCARTFSSSTAPTASTSRCRRGWWPATWCAWTACAAARAAFAEPLACAMLGVERARRGGRADRRGVRPRTARLPARHGGERAEVRA